MYALAIVLATVHVSALHPDFVQLFKPLEIHYTGGGYQNEPFRYRLFVPQRSHEPLPLVVWLHGFGEKGQDNTYHLKWLDQLIFHPPKRELYPFYLLAVQCPDDNPYWTVGSVDSPGKDDMIEVALAIIEKTLKEYPIDRQRVYISGISAGGSGCWSLALRRPELFAAVAPLASGGGDVARVKEIRDVPVWAFHSKDDIGTRIEGVRSVVEALRRAGGSVYLTEIDSSQHDCWTAAFEKHQLLAWLLTQRRGEPSPLPGSVPLSARFRTIAYGWKWWQALVQFATPTIFLVVVWKMLRNRRSQRIGVNFSQPSDTS